ncbi:MAG: PrpF domain-containing protein, partial [Alphaproteobacteria bacterium]
AIVAPSSRADADVDYLFAQIVVGQNKVDVAPTCGNILAGVGPFAIEQGLVTARSGETRVRIYMVNTKSLCTATVKTPAGDVAYDGDTAISGVPGAAAPILLDFENIAGSSCGALLPTGRTRDTIDGVNVTCIDNGMPVVVFAAEDVGRTGYEGPAALNADAGLKQRIEAIRLKAGPLMRLGDVTGKVVPKMTLVAPPREGGALSTRTFIPHVCHEAIGVLGAVSVATAAVLEGSAIDCAVIPPGDTKVLSVEHPTGEFTVQLETRRGASGVDVSRAALLRTARRLFDGNVLIPSTVWDGRRAA